MFQVQILMIFSYLCKKNIQMSCFLNYYENGIKPCYQEPLYIKFDNKEVEIDSYEITDPNQDILNYRGRPKREIEIDLHLDQMNAFSLYFELEEIYKDLNYYKNLKSKKERDKYLYNMANRYKGFSLINKANRFNKKPFHFNVDKIFTIGIHNCKLKHIRFQQRISFGDIISYWTIYGEVVIRD